MAVTALFLLTALLWALGASGESLLASNASSTYTDLYPYPAWTYNSTHGSPSSAYASAPGPVVSPSSARSSTSYYLHTTLVTVTGTASTSGNLPGTYTISTVISSGEQPFGPSASATAIPSTRLSIGSSTGVGSATTPVTSSETTSTALSTGSRSGSSSVPSGVPSGTSSDVSSVVPSSGSLSGSSVASEISSGTSIAPAESTTGSSLRSITASTTSPSAESSFAPPTAISAGTSDASLASSSSPSVSVTDTLTQTTSSEFSSITGSSPTSPVTSLPKSSSQSSATSVSTAKTSTTSGQSVELSSTASSEGSSATSTAASSWIPSASSSLTATLSTGLSSTASSSTESFSTSQSLSLSVQDASTSGSPSLSRGSTTSDAVITNSSSGSSPSTSSPASSAASNMTPTQTPSSEAGSTGSGSTSTPAVSSTSLSGTSLPSSLTTTGSETASSNPGPQPPTSASSISSPETIGSWSSDSPSLTTSVIIPGPSGFTSSSLTLPPPFTLTSIPGLSTIPSSAISATSTSSSSSSVSSSATPSPSANATATPYITPIHQIRLDNASYFMNPYCDEPPQVLWLSDGSNFTLYCDRVELFNGTVYAKPDDIPKDHDCSSLGFYLDDICWFRRFEFEHDDDDDDPTNSTAPWCNTVITPHAKLLEAMNMMATRDTTTSTVGDDPITDIAQKLVDMNHWTCEAKEAMLQVTVSIFNMAMQPESLLDELEDLVKDFFGAITGQTDDLLARLSGWIDQVDQTFLELYCYVDTETGRTSRIWRSLTHHHDIHVGMNVITSINRASHVNFLVKLLMDILKIIIKGIKMRYLSLIGAWGEGILALGQFLRACDTKWTEPAIRHPEDEPPEEGDEEDGLEPRFWIEGDPKQGALAVLRAVEGTLGVTIGGVSDDNKDGPWEVAGGLTDDGIAPGLLVDLSVPQALMAKAALMGQMTVTKMPAWEEFFSSVSDDGSLGPRADFVPVGDRTSESVIDPKTGRHNDQQPFISRPKGYDEKYNLYSSHSSQGAGTTIFFLDTGFTHEQYKAPGHDLEGRNIQTYVIPAQYTLPKRPKDPKDPKKKKVWPIPDTILDNAWKKQDHWYDGHGMAMVSVAAGNLYGVATKANLYMIKFISGEYKEDPGNRGPEQFIPAKQGYLTSRALKKAFQHVYDQVVNKAIPPEKSVVYMAYDASGRNSGGKETDSAYAKVWDEWRDKLDALGVTFVFANGNSGLGKSGGVGRYVEDEDSIIGTVDKNSPAILVGGVYHDGSLWERSSPMRGTAQISIYGLAFGVTAAISAGGQREYREDFQGCSPASAQVAGLAAYFLGYPWPEGKNPFDPADTKEKGSVGKRMKDYLISASYQRVPAHSMFQSAYRQDGDLQKNGWDFPYPAPSWVNVAYSLANGPQRCVNFPFLPAGQFTLGNETTANPDSCPVPEVVPGNNATYVPVTAITSTWTAEDAPTTISWTVTTNNTTFVTGITWAPTDRVSVTTSTSVSSSTSSLGPSPTSTKTSATPSSTSTSTSTTVIPGPQHGSAPPTTSSTATAPRITQTTRYHLDPSTSETFTLSTATVTMNPYPEDVTCYGPDSTSPGSLDGDITGILAQEFCVGGNDGTYGGYYPDGIPDTLSPAMDLFNVLSLAEYPGQQNPGNFSGLVYVADLSGPSWKITGEWSVARCREYFDKIQSVCSGGFYGGEATDPSQAVFRLYAHSYSSPNIPPSCWDENYPESRCSKWTQYGTGGNEPDSQTGRLLRQDRPVSR